MNRYLKNTKEEEVYITDDIVDFKDFYRFKTIIRSITYQNLRVHIRVRFEEVYRVEKLLDKGFEEVIQEDNLFEQWRLQDRNYIVELYKRGPKWKYEYLLRLYEDGNAVIIYWDRYIRKIVYINLKKNLLRQISKEADRKIRYIVSHPQILHEDDRDMACCGVQVYYNIYHKYPDADKRLKKYNLWECREYCAEEYENNMVSLILSAPEVKKYWGKLHL